MKTIASYISSACLVMLALGISTRAGDLIYDFASGPVSHGAPVSVEFSGGEAGVFGDYALLNDNIPYSSGSMRLGDLDPGKAVRGFSVAFDSIVGPGGGADGWALVFGGPATSFYGRSVEVEQVDVPAGDIGLQYKVQSDGGRGYFQIKVGATAFAAFVPSEAMQDNAPLPVTFKWTQDGGAVATLTTADGNVHRATASAAQLREAGLNIKPGHVFTFSGRTGNKTNWHRISRLSILTTP